jgi:ribosome-associated translation inhibitor RaiA
MKIQINTDKNIEADDDLAEQVRVMVGETLERFSERITRVEVYLSDENSGSKFGTHDMRCVLEVRLAGRSPTAVTHDAATWEQAVEGAAEKLMRSLESTLGRLDDHRQGATPQKYL